MSLLTRILRPAGRDWIFVGFIGVAVAASSYMGVQKVRYRNAIGMFETCVADATPDCAAASLEKLRSIDGDDVRTQIAEAQMRALMGEPDTAETTLAKMSPSPLFDPSALAKLSPEARGEVLLLSGDIAALRGDYKRADARWTEASGIVDPSLVKLRKKRVAEERDIGAAKISADLQAVRDDFDKLFESARNGDDGAAYAASALRTRVRDIKPALAAQKLSLAIDAADRCARLTRAKSISQNQPTTGRWTAPTPPIPPSDVEMSRSPWMRANYEREKARYKQNLARWEEQQSDQTRQRFNNEAEVGKTANSIIAEAQALLDSGLVLASRMPTKTAAR